MWRPPTTYTQRWLVAPGCVVPTGACSSHSASLHCKAPRPSVLQMPLGILGRDLKEPRSFSSVHRSCPGSQSGVEVMKLQSGLLFPLGCIASVMPRASWSHPISHGAESHCTHPSHYSPPCPLAGPGSIVCVLSLILGYFPVVCIFGNLLSYRPRSLPA